MAEETNNLTRDQKIDKLQWNVEALQNFVKDLTVISKETNVRLEAMQKGFITTDMFRDHQAFVRTLATNKDLMNEVSKLKTVIDDQQKQIDKQQNWWDWAIRLFIGTVVAGGGILLWIFKK